MNAFKVTASTAGMESTAKSRSVVSTTTNDNQERRCVENAASLSSLTSFLLDSIFLNSFCVTSVALSVGFPSAHKEIAILIVVCDWNPVAQQAHRKIICEIDLMRAEKSKPDAADKSKRLRGCRESNESVESSRRLQG